jgi:hypothetical protein
MRQPLQVAEGLIGAVAADLVRKNGSLAAALSETDPAGWSLEQYQIETARYRTWGLVEFQTTLRFCGTGAGPAAVSVAVRAAALQRGGRWSIWTCEVLRCSRELWSAVAA